MVAIMLSNRRRTHRELEYDAALCGLTQSEYLRQICLGKRPRPKQPPEFWEDYRPRSRQEQWAPQAKD